MQTAMDNNRSASYYALGPNLSIRDQFDVDAIVSHIFQQAKKEEIDKQLEDK